MYSDYWVKWVVVEDRIEEETKPSSAPFARAEGQRSERERGPSGWWRTVMLSVTAVGRGWMAEPATMARSRDIVLQLPAKEGYGAC